jgi:hypothetical protein
LRDSFYWLLTSPGVEEPLQKLLGFLPLFRGEDFMAFLLSFAREHERHPKAIRFINLVDQLSKLKSLTLEFKEAITRYLPELFCTVLRQAQAREAKEVEKQLKFHWKVWVPFLSGECLQACRSLALQRCGIDINKNFD